MLNNFCLLTVCQRLSSGLVLFIDITWDNVWPPLIDMLNGANVPYIHLDLSIKPFARTFFKYLQYTGTYDVAMIFQNEKGTKENSKYYAQVDHILSAEQYEGIYEVLNQHSIRSITFEGLSEAIANRIIKMRPMPTNFVIFARPKEMEELFQNVKKLFFKFEFENLKKID